MTREMADACNPANLPPGMLGAVYVDGLCKTTQLAGRRTISSTSEADADEGDVEPGNPYWPTWVDWVVRQRAHGNPYPWLYCCADGAEGSGFDGWRHADGVAAFAAAGVPEPLWRVFNLGATTIPSYAVACQVENGIAPGWDRSLLLDYIPGLDPDPPIPPGSEEDPMFIMTTTGQPALLVTGDLARAYPIPDQATETALLGLGLRAAAVAQSFYEAVYQAANKAESAA